MPFGDTATVKDSHLKLIKWTNENNQTERFYLMDKISHKWQDIGQLVGLSIGQLASISRQHHEDATECLRYVLGKWMESPPMQYPNTWHGLVELLNDCEFMEVTKELKIALNKANICQFPQE